MADKPRLKIAIATYGHTRALKDGSVPIEGVDPDFVEVAPIIGAFRRMVRDLEFDVCEMAPTTYMIARALGAPYIALPIFLMRRYRTVSSYRDRQGFRHVLPPDRCRCKSLLSSWVLHTTRLLCPGPDPRTSYCNHHPHRLDCY